MRKINTKYDFNLNRSLSLMAQCCIAIAPAINQDKLLLIGGTGAGKSTLLNYLNGARYEISVSRAGKPSASCVGGTEIAQVGHGVASQTLFPLIVKQPGLNYVYCDLAGLADSRDSEERICAANGVQMLSRLPGKIKGIVVVLDLPSFNTFRADAFKKVAIALAGIINHNNDLLDSVQFVITKVPKGTVITARDIIDVYISEILESCDNNDQVLMFILKAMQQRENQIHVPNISDHGESAREMVKIFNKLVPKGASKYTFINHDNATKKISETNKLLAC